LVFIYSNDLHGIGEPEALPMVRWLDYDPIAGVFLVVGIAAVVSLALSI